MENKQTHIRGINTATVAKHTTTKGQNTMSVTGVQQQRTRQELSSLVGAAMLAFLSASSSETSWTISG